MINDFSQYGLALSVLVFAVLALLEAIAPRKQRAMQRGHRWFTNITIIVLDSIVIRLMGPVAAIGAASFAAQQGIGLFHWINLPIWAAFILSLILLDLAIYAQHVLTHKIPILWSFHKVHHADRDIDVTTGLRFHPVEIILSILNKCVLLILIGPRIFAAD
jgi:sterol desaturase/sphingolipid hydroxylase (fatty acid hydroxylase superfamily)